MKSGDIFHLEVSMREALDIEPAKRFCLTHEEIEVARKNLRKRIFVNKKPNAEVLKKISALSILDDQLKGK
jgi:hypothetical protein